MSTSLLLTSKLHEQLRGEFTRRIVGGEWSPGSMIPNEGELARQYNLSTGTVRKALDWLVNAQLIVRQQGRGTYVLDPRSHDVMRRRQRLYDDRTGQPILDAVASSQLSGGPANALEIDRLQLSPDHCVYRIEQLRCRDGAKIAWERHVLPVELFPGLEERKHEIGIFAEFAFANGVVVGPGRESISCVEVPEPVASTLGVAVGACVLRFERVLNTIDGVPAAWRQAWYVPRGLVYEAELR